MAHHYSDWLDSIIKIAEAASSTILEILHEKQFNTRLKSDFSPVTEADLNAHEIIKAGLFKIDDTIPFLSEEGKDVPYSERAKWPRHWLVDPLDGTKEFINGSNDFTVNIALIENHEPVLGVVVAPMLQHYYWGFKGDNAYFLDKSKGSGKSTDPVIIKCQDSIRDTVKIAVSRHHHNTNSPSWDELLKKIGTVGKYELIQCGSALKICLVARGEADLYPRFGPTGEWDTAAGQCILEAASGKLVELSGNSLKYNQHQNLINPGFLAVGPKKLIDLCCG